MRNSQLFTNTHDFHGHDYVICTPVCRYIVRGGRHPLQPDRRTDTRGWALGKPRRGYVDDARGDDHYHPWLLCICLWCIRGLS